MKRTLLVTLEYPPQIGGVAHYYANIVKHLPNGSIYVLDNEKGELLHTHGWLRPKWIPAVINTYKAIKKYKIEHLLIGQVLPLGTVAWLLSFITKVPYTVMTHAMDITVPAGPLGCRRKKWLLQQIFKKAYRITTVSKYTKQRLEELRIPAKKIVVVHPCPHTSGLEHRVAESTMEELNKKYNIASKQVVLTVGRLVERKGVDVMLYAIAQLSEQHNNLVYVVVGTGPYADHLKKLASKLQIENLVIFAGAVPEEELQSWFQRCDIFAMPSRELENKDVEGFGIVFVEANSYGKPVIAGKSGGVTDAVLDGKTGYLIDPPTDAAMIAKAIARLLQDDELRHALGDQGRERVKEMFQWEIQAKKIEEMLSL